MANINKAQEAKKDKTLNTLVRYDEGVMSRKNWIELQIKNGSSVKESTKNRVQFDRRKFNRMMDYREQEAYEKRCSEQVVCYKLYTSETSYYEITKTEFDYFNSLKSKAL